jgi:hypothetical protein
MGEETIIISMRRDAAHYVSMLLGDQLLSINDGAIDSAMSFQLEPIRGAYEHVRETIEQALANSPIGRDRANQSTHTPNAVSSNREIKAQEARVS